MTQILLEDCGIINKYNKIISNLMSWKSIAISQVHYTTYFINNIN